MTTIPTIPDFSGVTVPSIADLQALSDCVKFYSSADVMPTWHFYFDTSNQIITASSWNTITYTQVAFDSDGVYDSPGAQIQTNGYYATTYCVDTGVPGTSDYQFLARFLITAGSHNPNLTSGSTQAYGVSGISLPNASGQDSSFSNNAMAPIPLYTGDTVVVQVFSDETLTIRYNSNISYIQGRFVPNFTGRMIRPV